MASLARKPASASAGRNPPRQPDYPDEITREQLNAITRLIDPDGSKPERRTLLHSAGW